jgi:antitoxin SocA-like protein
MAKVIDVAYYICFHASQMRITLSKARLVKLIYLADWKAAVDYGHQITDVQWYFNHFGPYVKEIIDIIEGSNVFLKCHYVNQFGNSAEEILLNPESGKGDLKTTLSEDNRKIIDYVLSITRDMSYMEFIRLIYSTYPIIKSNKFEKMDLEKLSNEYKVYKKENL